MLVAAGLIKDAADLYTLQIKDLLPLERMAQKSAENLIKGVQSSKQIPFERVLFGLGIRYVGETVAKILAKHYKTVHALSEASVEDLEAVDEIGIKIAKSVYAFFRNDISIRLLSRLYSYGLQLSLSEEVLANQTTLLTGHRIVVSGVFEQVSRNELKRLIEANGGKVVTSISSKTSYLIAGSNVGPSKRQKAENLGITILTEQAFLDKI